MASNEGATTKLEEPTLVRSRPAVLDSRLWRQVVRNVAYVLVAGPQGLVYVSLLAVGLLLDLPHLFIRLAVATSLRLLYSTSRGVLWILRFGLRFLWVGAIVIIVGLFQFLWWLISMIASVSVRMFSTVLVDIAHPRSAWQRAMRSMRGDRERVRTPRMPRPAQIWVAATPFRKRGDSFFDGWSAGLQQWRRAVVSDRWIFLPVLWWRLAQWEHSHTMRWLNVALPVLEPPRYTLVQRTTVMTLPPVTSLGFLLAKVPLGALALVLVMLGFMVGDWLVHIDIGGGVLVIPALIIFGLHMLALGAGRLAQRAFSPSAAMRRLQAAEATAAQERVKAERAEQSRRDLIINVGHELRTPTASILGHVESVLLALDGPEGQIQPETLRTYLGIVQREAERLSSLVDDLLAVARAERSELHLVFAPVNAAEVIHEVYQALAPLARRERHVMLVHEVEPDLPPLLADHQRLSQVLLNLLRNAITYTPEGGIVSIAACRNDDWLQITVADTGHGIAAHDLERVFERFYRTDESRARSSGGFGLGLAIAQDLVAAMGGTITAESTLGEGSAFHVMLPVVVGERRHVANNQQPMMPAA